MPWIGCEKHGLLQAIRPKLIYVQSFTVFSLLIGSCLLTDNIPHLEITLEQVLFLPLVFSLYCQKFHQ
jgi:hypothetical protein